MYEWVLDSVLESQNGMPRLHLAVPDDTLGHCVLYSVRKNYSGSFRDISHTDVRYNTRGPAETCMLCVNDMLKEAKKDGFWVLDNDILYDKTIQWDVNTDADALYVVVQELDVDGDTSPYSHVSIEGDISDIVEKRNIGSHVVLGAYGFSSPALYKRVFEEFLKSEMSAGEWFMSSVIKTAIKMGLRVVPVYSQRSVSIGIPEQVQDAINRGLFKPKPMRWVFDLDGTLVTPPRSVGDYSTVEPVHKTIKLLQYLYEKGHYIIIHTARHMKTCNGDVNEVVERVGDVTRNTLARLGVPYHELVFGKPYGHVYVDDLSTNPLHWQEGWTVGSIGFGWDRHIADTYSGNQKITVINGELCYKTARTEEAIGNLFFARNCPDVLKQHIPKIYDVCDLPGGSSKRILMEWKNDAIPLGKLLNSGLLGREIFASALDLLEKIHFSKDSIDISQQDVSANYCPKLEGRISEHPGVYSMFDINMGAIRTFFNRYEPWLCGCIHGDFWLSNLLWSHRDKSIYMIDMRGRLGNKPSLCGDRFYDYAKLLQSLVGFEKLVQDGVWEVPRACEEYTGMLAERFELLATEMDDIRKITAFLVLGSVPFHDKLVQNPREVKKLVASLWPQIFIA